MIKEDVIWIRTKIPNANMAELEAFSEKVSSIWADTGDEKLARELAFKQFFGEGNK